MPTKGKRVVKKYSPEKGAKTKEVTRTKRNGVKITKTKTTTSNKVLKKYGEGSGGRAVSVTTAIQSPSGASGFKRKTKRGSSKDVTHYDFSTYLDNKKGYRKIKRNK